MSSAELKDYYVGLIRGYLLAKDAPKQVTHALDVILSSYQPRAGDLIGGKDIVLPDKFTAESVIEEPFKPKTVEKISRDRWRPEEIDKLKEMKKRGSSASDIANQLNRKEAAIYGKICELKKMGQL